jgi:hypothetical protein
MQRPLKLAVGWRTCVLLPRIYSGWQL